MTRVLPALLLTLGLLVAGCGGDQTAPRAAESSAREERTTSVEAAGVSFAVPSGYVEADATDVAEGGQDDEAAADFADRLGISTDQFLAMVASVDVLLLSDERNDEGFVDNINVLHEPGAGLPSAAEVRLQLQRVGWEVERIEQAETGLGEAVVAASRIEVRDGLVVAGRGITVVVGANAVTITVAAVDPARADELTDGIVATLDAA